MTRRKILDCIEVQRYKIRQKGDIDKLRPLVVRRENLTLPGEMCYSQFVTANLTCIYWSAPAKMNKLLTIYQDVVSDLRHSPSCECILLSLEKNRCKLN